MLQFLFIKDWDGAANAKDAANEAKSSGNYEQAIEHFTKCLELGSVSAITLANRADCLLKCRRPLAAIADCNEALKINPDSAKALRLIT
jgi:suppressor of tumorigenicity protein 13